MEVSRVSDLDIAIYGVDDLESLRGRTRDRLELIDGEVFVTPSPSPVHQRISKRVFRVIEDAVEASGRGEAFYAPVDVVMDDATVLVPDIFVVLDERKSFVTESGVSGAPTLAVEIVSPTSRRADAIVKRDRYARAGVEEYWLLDPAGGTAVRYSQSVGGIFGDAQVLSRDDVLISTTVPGLKVNLSAIFEGIGHG